MLRDRTPRPANSFAIALTSLVLVLILVVPGGPARANQTRAGALTELSLEELANLEVTTASKVPESLQRTPAAVYVLSQEDIRRSGATSLPELLRLVPGVEVARIDSNKWAVGVRGFGSRLSRAVLVLIDGRSVYTPLFAGVYWEAQDILLHDVERIEVIRGPGGTVWGANAVNGVINVITKNARDTHGTYASVTAGNVDQAAASFRQGGRRGENLDYRFWAKGFSRDAEFHAGGEEFDEWWAARGGFRADWTPRPGDTITVSGDVYRERAGNAIAISTYSPPAIVPAVGDAVLGGGFLQGRWQRALESGSGLQVLAYYDRTTRDDLNFAERRDTFDVDFLHHFQLPRHSFVWGLGARASVGDSRIIVPTVEFVPHRLTDELYSGFVQDEIALDPRKLWLTVGSKLLYNNYTGFEVQPTARLLWSPVPRRSAWAAITRAVRTPSRVDRDLRLDVFFTSPDPDTPLFARVLGDRDFTSERTLGYEIGYRELIAPELFLDVALFYNDHEDLQSIEPQPIFLELDPAPPHLVLPFLLGNGLFGTTRGFEIAPSWTPLRWWRLTGAYSFLDIDLETDPGSADTTTANQIEGSSPRHQVLLRSSMDLPRELDLDLAYRYVSELEAQSVDSYDTADLRLAWATGNWALALVGRQVFERQHPEFGQPPAGIRRSYYVQLSWRD